MTKIINRFVLFDHLKALRLENKIAVVFPGLRFDVIIIFIRLNAVIFEEIVWNENFIFRYAKIVYYIPYDQNFEFYIRTLIEY